MTPLKVLLIGNLSDTRCGFQNYTTQMITALTRDPRVSLTVWDGTYPVVYARQQLPHTAHLGLLPPDVATFDVVHLIWHAMTMNHYNGVDWAELTARTGPIISWFDGGPSDASCPFLAHMQVRWSDYPKPGYHHVDYPVPDWITDLPLPAPTFTVGASSVRGDGVAQIRQACETFGWAMNLPTAGAWLSVEDEIRRLARSTVNVCWYNTPPLWHNRASAPSMLIAARRPLVINRDPLVAHLWEVPPEEGIYHGTWHADEGPGLEMVLQGIAQQVADGRRLPIPDRPWQHFRWQRAVHQFVTVWTDERERRRVP